MALSSVNYTIMVSEKQQMIGSHPITYNLSPMAYFVKPEIIQHNVFYASHFQLPDNS